MSAPKILVFDSGVGGLSILAELRHTLPKCQLVFACDNAAFPYGTKPEINLIERVEMALSALIHRLDPDIIVVACNSASTLVLPRIRANFQRPIVGVVPAIKPAAMLSTSKCIGLLATPGTVQRPYTQKLIDDFASHCQVVAVGSAELVELAEQKLRGETPDNNALKTILAPFLAEPRLDTIVLACTHFPLLREELSKAAERHIKWVDSGAAIARRVLSLLGQLPDELPPQPHSLALFTAPQPAALVAGLKQYGCVETDVVEI
ncbi:glutamate racemase [Porticoccus sp. W117]|uniref:glutamate racemase n=1 Tax=Porticoccus sp. W117 TaxID=3054777 RepID=UPI00259267AD|nr:glutamate racemase [Porticoccus sp. W117]MDM3870161.1 glutamate racemase [Porticoccus sp. W117]